MKARKVAHPGGKDPSPMPKPKGPGTSQSSGESGSHAVRGAEPAGTDGSPMQSLFRPGDDNTVRGEVVVKLAPTAAPTVTSSIPTGPLGIAQVGVPNGFGIP